MSRPVLLWCTRETVLETVAVDGHCLATAPEDLRGDRQVVLAAVRNNGEALRHASDDLRGD
eukprot:2530799-Amphidinium_carterae.1